MKLETPCGENEVAALVAELKMLATPPAAVRVFSRPAAATALPRARRKLATALLLVLAASLAAGITWAMHSRLEEVVRGEGKVIPDTVCLFYSTDKTQNKVKIISGGIGSTL
jgi:hypothetical protein